ncbi:hypothetical protein [Streptomyces sp. NPDC001820]
MSESEVYALLINGFREVSTTLDQTLSTLAADPVLDELANRVEPLQESDEIRQAILYVLDSHQEFSGAAEIVQYFADRFQWAWMRDEVEKRYLDCLANRDIRLTRHFERMLEAFSPDWEDRELFPSLDRH